MHHEAPLICLICGRKRLVKGLDFIDSRMVAVTVTHYPESRTLAANEADDPTPSGQGTAIGNLGYDPAYLLPFCCQVSYSLVSPGISRLCRLDSGHILSTHLHVNFL